MLCQNQLSSLVIACPYLSVVTKSNKAFRGSEDDDCAFGGGGEFARDEGDGDDDVDALRRRPQPQRRQEDASSLGETHTMIKLDKISKAPGFLFIINCSVYVNAQVNTRQL